MKKTSHNTEARDAAFDARVRSMLEGAAAAAPAPRPELFAPAVGIWGKLGMATAAGLLLWGAVQLTGVSPVEPAEPTAAPEAVTPAPVSVSPEPVREVATVVGNAEENAENEGQAEGVQSDEVELSLDRVPPAGVTNVASENLQETQGPSAKGQPVKTTSEALLERVSVERPNTTGELETENDLDIHSSEGSAHSLPAAAASEKVSLPQKETVKEEVQDTGQPTLTLPLTLPSGGGE